MRAKIVELINENKGESLPRIKPLQKRVLITKIVADTHERLARSGSFRRAFLATGTWLATDHSVDSEVDLQGVDFNYKEVISLKAIEDHQNKVEAQEAKVEQEKNAKIKLAEEKAAENAKRLAPAISRSKLV